VSVTLHLVIAPMIIPMNVCLHDLMLIRAAIVRSILRADQRRSQHGHRKSRQGDDFPRMLAHCRSPPSGLGVRSYGDIKQAAIPRR